MGVATGLLTASQGGIHCPAGGFHIDPWRPVERALITHAHSDHACPGSLRYLCSRPGEMLLRSRLGPEAVIESVAYGETVSLDGVQVSFHPSGHILGSAQIRIERSGEVWVVSGDYKLEPDRTCAPFEPLHCHVFVTESTFGLPIFRWPKEADVFEEINAWWKANREGGKSSVLYAYTLGKAQRVLAGVDAGIGPIVCHGSVSRINAVYRDAGVALPDTAQTDAKLPLVIAPPFAANPAWLRRFHPYSTAMVSGWMRIRGTRRRRALDRGFVLSDHADWPALLAAVRETGASRVWATHGYRGPFARWLSEQGIEAEAIETRFEGELTGEAEEQ